MSENGDLIKKRERANLTDYQKNLIVFLSTELNFDIDRIRKHDKLKTQDGKNILKKTVIYWLNRYKETGDLKIKERTGRPRLLNETKEKRLIKYIQNNSNTDYQEIKKKLKLNMTRRTINNYALRNEIRSNLSKDDKSARKKKQPKNIKTASLPQNIQSNISRRSLSNGKNVESNLNTSLIENHKPNVKSIKKLPERRSRRSLVNNRNVQSNLIISSENKPSVKSIKKLPERRSRRNLEVDENIALNS